MKIKIIDLLNKIANGEEVPKKIKYEKDTYIHIDNYCYYCEDTNLILSDRIFAEYSKLNDEVEILEETKKIDKIRIDYNSINIDKAFETGTTTFFREKDIEIFQCLSSKINELIDAINNLKEK